MKKTILWVTADYFVDCDFTPIKEISKVYDVHWIVLRPQRNARFKETDFEDFKAKNPHVVVEFFPTKGRFRGFDPRCIIDNLRLASRMRALQTDYYYLNVALLGPWSLFLWNKVKDLKIIVTAHLGAVHDGFKFKKLAKFMHRKVYRHAKLVNMFSQSQAALFKAQYPKPEVWIISLALKDFTSPTIRFADGSDRTVCFLSFGVINYSKHIDLLIDAACNLYEKGLRNFKVSINGKCDNWEFYRSRIRYPEIFDCDIRLIENKEIPNLFVSSHYFVQPYRIVTQSGAIKVAFNYYRPVIASDLPGFTGEVKEGINGFLFKPNDVKDLERVMKDAIIHHAEMYDSLVEKMKDEIRENYSNEAIGRKYIAMFERLENY